MNNQITITYSLLRISLELHSYLLYKICNKLLTDMSSDYVDQFKKQILECYIDSANICLSFIYYLYYILHFLIKYRKSFVNDIEYFYVSQVYLYHLVPKYLL